MTCGGGNAAGLPGCRHPWLLTWASYLGQVTLPHGLLVSLDAKRFLWALPSLRSHEAMRSVQISWRSCLHLWVCGPDQEENVIIGTKTLGEK